MTDTPNERPRTANPAVSSPSSLARPSDLSAGPATAAAAPSVVQPGEEEAHSLDPGRPLPPVMKLAFQGGETVELLKDQYYADRVVVRAGERGKTLFPSSQAAAWVVHFPRKGGKPRVVPEWLLKRV